MSENGECHEPPRSTVYGPVPSWRYGQSLGIDPILETSTCSFNCIYCQLGNINRHIADQDVFVATEQILHDLKPVEWDQVDIVAVSGSGEPTLALNIGEIIDHIKDRYHKPVLVLTNSVHLRDASTRNRVRRADVVECKLDAPNDEILRVINRPVEGVTVESIVRGIEALRDEEFTGKLTLQCMLMPVNIKSVPELAQLIKRIGPDEIHLNTPKRPYPRQWYLESRGDHLGKVDVPKTPLKTISEEEAEEAERIIKERNPGIKIHSVYRHHSEQ